eukprot:TRINITY_DN24191_c0_g1_i1.p1 TRINITY_DN24191_c0_g1~~TRINITY_DN24191_c0_g1_i1.p1  ORF type:complete len:518 (-),score=59.45 TRINITY_DN24191_c0_g1_i1:93-1646(-)
MLNRLFLKPSNLFKFNNRYFTGGKKDSNIDALLREIKDVQFTKIPWTGIGDPEMQVASLPSANWLTIRNSHLFVRKPYEPLWKLIQNAYHSRFAKEPAYERVLILGNSGIGKTVALNYFLIRALQENIQVLFETRVKRYFFGSEFDSEPIVESRLLRYYDDESVIVLHDHQPKTEPPIISSGAFLVAPVSPDPKNYHEFDKQDTLTLWMPLPTKNELAAMNSVEWRLDTKEFDNRVALYGPIPRLVFQIDQQKIQNKLKSKIRSFDFGKHYFTLLNEAQLPDDKHGLSWWVVHIDAAENLREASKISWASNEIFNQFMTHNATRKLVKLENFISKYLVSPPLFASAPTMEYQRWATFKIASGIRINVIWYTWEIVKKTQKVVLSDSGESIELNPADPIPVKGYSLAHMKQTPDVVYYSKTETEALCDAVVLRRDGTLILFQMTIGEKHEISATTLNKWAKNAKENGIERVELIFVVPYKTTFKLPLAELKKAQKANVLVGVLELTPLPSIGEENPQD